MLSRRRYQGFSDTAKKTQPLAPSASRLARKGGLGNIIFWQMFSSIRPDDLCFKDGRVFDIMPKQYATLG
jgi:hypothetical protein